MSDKKQDLIFSVLDEIDISEMTPDMQWEGRYPTIQWNNQSRSWEFVLDNWAGSVIELNHPLIQVDHGDTDLPGFLLETINVAPLAAREIWEYKDADGKMVRADRPNMSDGNKWGKRYNFFVLLKESGDLEPAIITVGGYTGEALYNALRQGRKRLQTILKAIGRPNLPVYLFWLELIAGPKQTVGTGDKKSNIWPPVVIVPQLAEMDLKELGKWMTDIYIGHPAKDALAEGLYEDAQEWKTEHRESVLSLPPGNGNGQTITIAEDGTLYIPDLRHGNKDEWLQNTIDVGLFPARDKAHKAFLSVVRAKGLKGPTSPQQWDAWKTEIERLWADKLQREEDEARELDLR